MNFRHSFISFFVSFFLVLSTLASACPEASKLAGTTPEEYAYDRGPDPDTEEGRAILDHFAAMPFLPGVSLKLMGSQKFRPDFGAVMWRRASDYPVKILVQGQDATHIAEAANRTATAGFGGRAQDLVNYFGVDVGAAFWNAYQNTIKGQYGAFESPYFYRGTDGKMQVRFGSFVDNGLWAMTHQGAHAAWTNKFRELMIKQNPELAMLVLFGGAARDSTANFINSLPNGEVGTRNSEKDMKRIMVTEMELRYAGGNNEFPVPIGRDGKDLYSEKVGRKLDYSKPADQKAAKEALEQDPQWFMDHMVFSEGGPFGNGLIHPGQLGGFDLRKMKIDGKSTNSLKGLQLSDGTVVDRHIAVAQLPHPSALSRKTPEQAANDVANAVKAFDPLREDGWTIEADPGRTNHYEEGNRYKYGRADLAPAFYEPFAPASREVSVSSASRMPGSPWGIIIGTRDRAKFNDQDILAARNSQPSEHLDPNEVWTGPMRGPKVRYKFDRGPGTQWMRDIRDSLDLKTIFAPKRGKTFKKDGIAAYNVKNHPETGAFGHFRGDYQDPKVLVLADPHGLDDIATSLALTGARGQYLHGIMKDTGVGDKYLVMKTVPFRMEGASPLEWGRVIDQTREYRDKLIKGILERTHPEVIVADGPQAKAELERILGADPRIVNIQRGKTAGYGIKAGGQRIAKKLGSKKKISGQMVDLPRSHFPYMARAWEGRGGDHVFTSTDATEGQAMAIVAPEWATSQEVALDPDTEKAVEAQLSYLEEQGLRMPGESIPDYAKRMEARDQEESAPRRAVGGN
jgi:hypothetical protein